MIAGWDQELGPNLYYCDSEGTRKGQKFSVGSGSPYAYGVLDEVTNLTWKLRSVRAWPEVNYHATYRNAMSGGFVSVYHVHVMAGPRSAWTIASLAQHEAEKGGPFLANK